MNLTLIDDMSKAEQVWRPLEESGVCTYYQTFDWLLAWQKHVGERLAMRPRIVVVSNADGAPLALLPLGQRTTSSGRALLWMGGHASVYLGPILTLSAVDRLDDQALERLFAGVAYPFRSAGSRCRIRHGF